MDGLLQRATEVYGEVYFLAIIASALLEWVMPSRPLAESVRVRWFGNFTLTIVGGLMVRAVFPIAGIGWAALCASRHWGLFNIVTVPTWLAVVVSLMALDLLYYVQHYCMHKIPVLWRAHRTHHTDQDFDLTTGARAHPAEAILTNLVILGGIVALGAPPFAVFLNQVLSIALAFLGHSNVRVPAALDRALRLVLVTPDMHRVHHSVNIREGESNFSNLFPWWDRIFSTYIDQPEAGHQGMTFGVKGFLSRKHLMLPWMLAQPFLREDAPEPHLTSERVTSE